MALASLCGNSMMKKSESLPTIPAIIRSISNRHSIGIGNYAACSTTKPISST
jgi:hypothetical protein